MSERSLDRWTSGLAAPALTENVMAPPVIDEQIEFDDYGQPAAYVVGVACTFKSPDQVEAENFARQAEIRLYDALDDASNPGGNPPKPPKRYGRRLLAAGAFLVTGVCAGYVAGHMDETSPVSLALSKAMTEAGVAKTAPAVPEPVPGRKPKHTEQAGAGQQQQTQPSAPQTSLAPQPETKPSAAPSPKAAKPKPPAAPQAQPAGGSKSFNMATFNVLGNSHTARGGDKAGMREGRSRIKDAINLFNRYKVDVVGVQEFSYPMRLMTKKVAGDQFGAFPALGTKGMNAEDTVLWRKSTVELVDTDTISLPYFNRWRDNPRVKLRLKSTGEEFWVGSFHNPANIRGNKEARRNLSEKLERQMLQTTKAKGETDFAVADWNEHTDAYKRLTLGGLAFSSWDRCVAKKCVKRPKTIDEIFVNNPKVSFGPTIRERYPSVSDHPIVVAKTYLNGRR